MTTRSSPERLEAEIASLKGESYALQILVAELAAALRRLSPQADEAVAGCFDNASLLLEHYAVSGKGHPAYFPKALRLADELRAAVYGRDQPKGLV